MSTTQLLTRIFVIVVFHWTLVIGHWSFAGADEILLADFEGKDYGEWKVTGEAFGTGPARGTLPNQMHVSGYLGEGLVNTYFKGDDTQGTLTSPEFKLQRKFVNFLIGGGRHPGEACINLLVDDKVARTASGSSSTPQDTEHLSWHTWDVADLAGKTAHIEIVDRRKGDWGHINVDHIVQADSRPKIADEREELLARARESVRRAAERVKDDKNRPLFHLLPPGNWVNDPNGPIWHNGWYHMFYQHNPYGDAWGHMHWGHARSKDLVRWEHLPIALWPSKSKGEEHVFSGCAVTTPEGKLMLLYTSIGQRAPEQWAALSENDEATVFRKHPANPLLTEKHHGAQKIDDWRDPFVFREKDRWYMVVGGHRAEGKGGICLYISNDLLTWKYLGVAFEGTEKNWECPLLFKLGEKWVLVYSPHGLVKYYTGNLDVQQAKFTPQRQGTLDHGNYYAPNCLADPQGRRIMWGWVKDFPSGKGWNGCLTVPRVITLAADGTLRQAPLPQLAELRGTKHSARPLELASSARLLEGCKADALEIVAEFEPGDAKSLGLKLRRSDNGQRSVNISFDGSELAVAGTKVPFKLLPEEKTLRLHVLLDRSVLEVYANGRECVTRVISPAAEDLGVEVFSADGKAKVISLDAWEMGSIW